MDLDSLFGRIATVFVINLVIMGLQFLSNRYLPELRNRQSMGLYLILLPLGFGLFRWELPYWAAAPFILGGVWALLVVFRGALDERSEELD